MSSPGVGLAFGIRRLVDANQRWARGGLPVFYVVKNFDDNGEDYSEMGFEYLPSLTGALVTGGLVGTTQIQVVPQPAVILMTLKQIADATAAGSELRMGARSVTVSHTWVKSIQLANGYSNPNQVFTDDSVVGFYHDRLLYQIVSYTHRDLYGDYVDWNCLCNANEIATDLDSQTESIPMLVGYNFSSQADGIRTIFTLPANVACYNIFQDGNFMSPNVDYTATGKVINFTEAPPSFIGVGVVLYAQPI